MILLDDHDDYPFDYSPDFRNDVYQAVCGKRDRVDFYSRFPLLYYELIPKSEFYPGYRGKPKSISQSEIDFFNGKTTVIDTEKFNAILSQSIWRVLNSPISQYDLFMINMFSTTCIPIVTQNWIWASAKAPAIESLQIGPY